MPWVTSFLLDKYILYIYNLCMENVHVRITGAGQDLNFLVSSEVASKVVRMLNDAAFSSPVSTASMDLNGVSAKYRPLAQHLATRAENRFMLSFTEIETILGEKLPKSAYKHKAWWANSRTHSQATAWMTLGFSTAEVYPELRTITFQKGGDV